MTSPLVKWATMPWLKEAPPYLTQQWRSYGSMGKMSGREGDVGWGFKPMVWDLAPFFGILSPSALTLAPFRILGSFEGF